MFDEKKGIGRGPPFIILGLRRRVLINTRRYVSLRLLLDFAGIFSLTLSGMIMIIIII